MSKIYLTGCRHHSHINITGPKLSRWESGYRNFESVEEMNDALIDSVNSIVQPEDTLIDLGDIFMGQVELTAPKILDRIKCRNTRLVYGNHCTKIRKTLTLQKLFVDVQDYLEIRYKGLLICMLHYPMATWNEAGKGSLHAHSHCHGNYIHPGKAIDVGWDVHKRPIHIDEFVELASSKKVDIVDHHTERTSY